MPEGDTIFRAARTLHAALAGRTVTRFASSLPQVAAAARHYRIEGRAVRAVEARGKHLIVRFEGGPSLHTHMRMTGSWHLYRAGTPWRKSAAQARAVIETGDRLAVCFSAPVVEWLTPAQEAEHGPLVSLGPDLLAPGFDAARARTNLRTRATHEIGAALMDQRALAGIGNVYKSETLFLCGVDPFARVEALDDATLDRLIATAVREMKRNVAPAAGLRRTREGPERVWVYRREGEGCLRCGTVVRMQRQGEGARSTYWCPRCQPAVPV
ncbi:MAG: DNA-formamidopyrimidine glycosylase family protein [Vicinamibacteria bacterium]